MNKADRPPQLFIDIAFERMRWRGAFLSKFTVNALRKEVEQRRKRGEIYYELPTDPEGVRHYIAVTELWVRLAGILERRELAECEKWNKEDFYLLKNTGLLFRNCVATLLCLNDKDFLFVLRECIDNEKESLLIDKDRRGLECYISSKCQKFNKEERVRKKQREKHDELESMAAVPFLREMGCQLVSTEVCISGKKKIDALGWCNDGKIIGIECKVRKEDYFIRAKKERIEEYRQFCNALYILTSEKEIFEDVLTWSRESQLMNMGAVLWNAKKKRMEKVKHPIYVSEYVDKKMSKRAREMVVSKVKKSLDELRIDDDVNDPRGMLNKIEKIFEELQVG